MNRMIKVSIIIPVFNSAHLVEQTIRSVLQQNFREWEMIVIDDGSSDNIKQLIEQCKQEDNRIKFLQQQNAGASAARNTGIKNANHDWLLFLDADDWMREDFFEKMIRVLEEDSSVDVVHCGWTRISEDGTATKENFGGAQSDMFPSLAHYCPFAIHACIVRKKAVENAGYFDSSFKTCGDWDLWQRVARTGARFRMVKECMAFYRTRANSLSSDGTQFCVNGLQVISNAQSFDARVFSPKPEYRNGLKAGDHAEKKFYFVAWCAGMLIGEKKSASHLLTHLEGLTATNLNPDFLSETLLDSIMIHSDKKDRIYNWKVIEDSLEEFLVPLEKQCEIKGLAYTTLALIERHVIKQAAAQVAQLQIGKAYAERINVEMPIEERQLPLDVNKFYGFIFLKENLLGTIEVELIDNFLPAASIKDAIATKFSWQILQYFFSHSIYPLLKLHDKLSQLSEDDLHNKIGWVTFLQQLWQKPGWEENMFYESLLKEKESTTVIKVRDEVQIEVADELPILKTRGSTLKVNYYIAGSPTGNCLCAAKKNYVSPQMLIAAITMSCKYELCRVAVREALIGNSLDAGLSLRQRLHEKRLKLQSSN